LAHRHLQGRSVDEALEHQRHHHLRHRRSEHAHDPGLHQLRKQRPARFDGLHALRQGRLGHERRRKDRRRVRRRRAVGQRPRARSDAATGQHVPQGAVSQARLRQKGHHRAVALLRERNSSSVASSASALSRRRAYNRFVRTVYILCLLALASGCGGNNTSSTSQPGSDNPDGGGIDGDGGSPNAPLPPRMPDLVWNENQKPGDDGWHADFSAGDPDFNLYVRPQSVFAGDTVDVQVSAGAHSAATWQVYRLGYYAGAGGRKLANGDTTIDPQPAPTIDSTTGMVECAWGKTFSIPVGADWVSGVYLARVELPDGTARFAPFIVRDRRAVDVLAVLPTNTDQAYNPYGGESLYIDTRFGLTAGHGYKVSFDRPFDINGQGGYFLYSAMPTVEYLEANGYDVTYSADVDVHVDSSNLTRARLVMALAHDEYWSRTMRDHYEAARAAGVSEAFLGANIGFWQVRFEPGADGTPNRRMVGYKEAAALDPLASTDPADVTAAFRGDVLNRPENALLGVMSGDWHFADFPWRVSDASHWIYDGMGVQN